MSPALPAGLLARRDDRNPHRHPDRRRRAGRLHHHRNQRSRERHGLPDADGGTVVVGPPANLTYSANPATYTVNTPIAANTPSSTGGTIVSYAVTPALPAGLLLDATTGVITGTPTAETPRAAYTISGTNTEGSTTAALDITVAVSPTPAGFSSTGSMATAREYHTATRLSDGKVLVVGGFDGSAPVRTAELYDPATGLFTPTTGSMTTPRQNHSASLLADGKVLIAGGLVNNNLVATATAEIYDPGTGTFSAAANSMPDARSDFTATTLPSGKVLIAGGAVRSTSTFLTTATLYDPTTRSFGATGSLRTGRAAAVAVLLQGGKVLVAGGAAGGSGSSVTYLASAEIYDGATGLFTATGPMPVARLADTATALQVSGSPPAASGAILVAGGATPFSLATADLYDQAGGTFAATGSMAESRSFQTASLLPDGRVLVAGGSSGSSILSTSELYDPVLGAFAPSGHDMVVPRYRQTATELQDGRVLVAGGRNTNGVLSTARYPPRVPDRRRHVEGQANAFLEAVRRLARPARRPQAGRGRRGGRRGEPGHGGGAGSPDAHPRPGAHRVPGRPLQPGRTGRHRAAGQRGDRRADRRARPRSRGELHRHLGPLRRRGPVERAVHRAGDEAAPQGGLPRDQDPRPHPGRLAPPAREVAPAAADRPGRPLAAPPHEHHGDVDRSSPAAAPSRPSRRRGRRSSSASWA